MLTIIGVGDSGGRVLNQMIKLGLERIHYAAVNTNQAALEQVNTPDRLLLGNGLGAGGNPQIAHAAAMEKVVELKQLLNVKDRTMVIGGLGGGTASGVIPVIGTLAEHKPITAIVTIPYAFEGSTRHEVAEHALMAITIDKVVVDPAMLLPFVRNVANLQHAFALLDHLLMAHVLTRLAP